MVAYRSASFTIASQPGVIIFTALRLKTIWASGQEKKPLPSRCRPASWDKSRNFCGATQIGVKTPAQQRANTRPPLVTAGCPSAILSGAPDLGLPSQVHSETAFAATLAPTGGSLGARSRSYLLLLCGFALFWYTVYAFYNNLSSIFSSFFITIKMDRPPHSSLSGLSATRHPSSVLFSFCAPLR